MRTLAVSFITCALAAALALAQTPDPQSRVLYFTHADTSQRMQEITNIIRSMADTAATFDAAKKSITVPGNSTQIALAEWVLSEMDRATPSGTVTTQSFRDQRGQVDVVRLFALSHVSSAQQIMELTNLIRSVADLQRVFPYHALNQLVVRGGAQQVAIAEWLIQQLDRAPDTAAPDAGTRDIPFGFKGTHTIKVFYLTHAQSPEQARVVVSQVQGATKIDRAPLYNALHAVALRGTADQLTAAAALLKDLDAR